MSDNKQPTPKQREEAVAKASTVEGEKAEKRVTQRVRLGALAIFEIVRREGAEELQRPASSLWWSGVAAGLALAMSAATAGMIHAALPPGPARELLMPLGYVIGFLIVVFGRLQLFTENTIAAVLPLAANPTTENLVSVGRLYAVVFSANLAGALIAAIVLRYVPVLTETDLAGLLAVSRHALEPGWGEVLARAVPAGFLIAAMVWMLPSAKGAEFFVVTAIIYVLVLGEFTHAIVGAAEAFLLLVGGEIGAVKALLGFILPAFVGNMIGGAALFAMLAYAQIRDEVRAGVRERMF
ncbi:transporter (formate/nitrite transporter family protein) [Marinicauda salina]|uniref:Transporter (Formate/nitrite transporter family protein) n=1 Tax=Marinicauda salina TaxID=2135793 RepID=A0A2U2BRT3_9PROT|nr:formate/nitrite transporter family protein [Marinicauda salina]PWE16705.1 transporter (formate/nitrite transporter family protein) [Marinicauda salina]